MIDCAYEVNIPKAESLWKHMLPEADPSVTVAVIGRNSWNPGFAWVQYSEDPVMVVLENCLAPAFASWCLIHELAHVRQWYLDYDSDTAGMLADYGEYAWNWHGKDQRGFNLTPWEAEAHLTAWEYRMTVLCTPGKPGVVDRNTPPDPYRFAQWSDFDLHEIIDLGHEYREGMGR